MHTERSREKDAAIGRDDGMPCHVVLEDRGIDAVRVHPV